MARQSRRWPPSKSPPRRWFFELLRRASWRPAAHAAAATEAGRERAAIEQAAFNFGCPDAQIAAAAHARLQSSVAELAKADAERAAQAKRIAELEAKAEADAKALAKAKADAERAAKAEAEARREAEAEAAKAAAGKFKADSELAAKAIADWQAAEKASAAKARGPLPGGYAVGEKVFYAADNQTFPRGRQGHARSGRRGEGGATDTKGLGDEGVASCSRGTRATSTAASPTLSRAPPPPLPGGYAVGETVYFTGESQTVANGDKVTHGGSGEVMGHPPERRAPLRQGRERDVPGEQGQRQLLPHRTSAMPSRDARARRARARARAPPFSSTRAETERDARARRRRPRISPTPARARADKRARARAFPARPPPRPRAAARARARATSAARARSVGHAPALAAGGDHG